MTNNAWNTPTMDSVGDGKTLIGSGSGRPASALITGDSDVTITPGAKTLSISSAASGGDLIKISTATASASASIDFTGLSSTYHLYIIRFSNLAPASDQTLIYLRTSTDNGVSFDTGVSDYAWVLIRFKDLGEDLGNAASAADKIEIAGRGMSQNLGNASNETGSGHVYIFNPSATEFTHIFSQTTYISEAAELIFNSSAGHRAEAAAVDAVRLIMNTGNITSGEFVLYGVNNA